MKVEFQYFEGCPNAAATLENLKTALKELGTEEEIGTLLVNDPASAAEVNFQGSPTIVVDGYDIYTMERPEGYAFTCRIYEFDGKETGIIPVSFIKDRIAAIMGQKDSQ